MAEKLPTEPAKVNKDEYSPLVFTEKLLDSEFDEVFRQYPLTENTTCGFGFLRGKCMQIFANKKAFVFCYGIAGSVFAATYAYFNGTITTIEKRYKIPSRNTGLISTGNDISSLLISAILAYYAGKGHRPRWIGFGLLTVVAFCVITALPHFLYGPGEQALSLTKEFGASENDSMTLAVLQREQQKTLCRTNVTAGIAECDLEEGSLMPQILLFIGQLIAGVGQCLFYTLGSAYIDDNVKKSKTPALISFSYFLRLLGPAAGYALASFCLKLYISPELRPTITNIDPRWLGAWWLGWLALALCLLAFAFILCMFPKELPRSAVRKRIASERRKRGMKNLDKEKPDIDEIPASVSDMLVTFKRLITNPTFMLNSLASIFTYFGFMPYWIFTPKYIETQYKQSASTSSLVTGTVALAFSALGVLSSGIVISKFKPRARYLAIWNVFVGILSVLGMIAYSYLGCIENENSIVINHSTPDSMSCNFDCHCDYVKYSPVCGEDNKTYISACHAGCKISRKENNTKIFEDCSCISNTTGAFDTFALPSTIATTETTLSSTLRNFITGGSAKDGACPINCQREFVLFLAVMCFIKFCGATGRASNFLVSVRCVEERDKTVSMGLGLTFMCLFAFIPSPIFFGTLFDKTCLVWGKTCGGKGNCWLYDGEFLRKWMNIIAACFVSVGTMFDAGVWFFVKNLKIFDEEPNDKELEMNDKDEGKQIEKAQS